MRRRLATLVLIGSVVALAVGCRGAPTDDGADATAHVITELDVRIDAHDTTRRVTTEPTALGQRVTALVGERVGWTTMNDGRAVTGQLDLVVYDAPRSVDVAIVLSARLRGADGMLVFDTEVRDRVPGPVWDADPDASVEAAARALARNLEWLGGVERRDSAVVRDALVRSEADILAAALTVVSSERDRSAVPMLVERLPDLSSTDYVRVVGALAQIGAPESLSPIIDALDLDDPDTVLAVLPAIARFDGPEPAGFITALAAGHDDPRVRLHATRALERVRP